MKIREPNPSRSKNTQIEVLRGFAILLAVFSHLGSPCFWGNPTYGKMTSYVETWSGVDLFFCISILGYLVSLLEIIPVFSLAEANYRFIEMPLRKHGVRIAIRFRESAKVADLKLIVGGN